MDLMETAAQAQDIAPAGTVPDWVHILPLGHIEGRDGRSYELPNPVVVVNAFAAYGADLPVDYEHQAINPAAKAAGPIAAAGWIKTLKATAEGVLAKIDWTDKAREMIAAKEYRFISPVIQYDRATRAIKAISGAGLVHLPNLHLQALNAQEVPATPAQPDAAPAVAALLDLLGLTAAATATEVAVALLARAGQQPAAIAPQAQEAGTEATALGIPDPARYVEVTALNGVLERAAQEREVATGERIKTKIDGAIKEGFITNGMRKWATALCSQSEALFDDFCARSGPTFAYLMKPAGSLTGAQADSAAASHDPLSLAVCEQLGLKPGSLSD